VTSSDAACLDALAACVGAGVSLPDALARIETAGIEASRWAARVRPFVRPGARVEDALLAARAVEQPEHALLALAVTPDDFAQIARALTARRRRKAALGRSILRVLLGPFAVAVLTVVLDPLPNIVGPDSYVWPVARGLVELGLATALLLLGVPAALRSPAIGPPVLRFLARVPGLATLAASHAEAELVTLAAPFVARPEGGSNGLLATATLLAWSPLADPLRAAAQASTTTPDWALAKLAPYLSVPTNLAIVSGIASGQLTARLAALGDEIAAALARRLQLTVRIAAYVLVVLLSLTSLAEMVGRTLPGSSILGGAPSAEQKQLDEIMKALDEPERPAKPGPAK
jgi:hypothetical protein